MPVNPYNKEDPNNNKPEEKDPRIKYFKPASVEKAESRLNEAKAYKAKLCISIDKYKTIKSWLLTRMSMPKQANNNKMIYSKALICSCFINDKLIKITRQVKIKMKHFANCVKGLQIKLLENNLWCSKEDVETRKKVINKMKIEICLKGRQTKIIPSFEFSLL